MHAVVGTPELLQVVELQPARPLEKVPARIYRIRVDQFDNISLVAEKRTRYAMPSKIYGEHYGYLKRINQCFAADSKSMGVLLTGKRGSGKSLLAEELANHTLKR